MINYVNDHFEGTVTVLGITVMTGIKSKSMIECAEWERKIKPTLRWLVRINWRAKGKVEDFAAC